MTIDKESIKFHNIETFEMGKWKMSDLNDSAFQTNTSAFREIAEVIKTFDTEEVLKVYVQSQELIMTAPDNKETLEKIVKLLSEKTNHTMDGSETLRLMRHCVMIMNICTAVLYSRGVGISVLPEFLKDIVGVESDAVITVNSKGEATLQKDSINPEFSETLTSKSKRVLH